MGRATGTVATTSDAAMPRPSSTIARLHRLVTACMAMLLLAISGHAAAATCSGAAQTITIPMPAFVSVPANAAVGTILTSFSSVTASNLYTCASVSGQSNGAGVAFNIAAGLAKINGLTVSPGGTLPLLSVFATSVPGIGVAVAVRALNGSCGAGPYLDLGGIGSSGVIPSPWVGSTCVVSGSASNGAQVQAALVKTAAGAAGVGTIGGTIFQGASVVQQGSGNVVQTSGAGAPGVTSFVFTPVTDVPPSCSTPDVTVSMGNYPVASFKGVGSTTRPVAFSLAINNCSAGLSKITYQFSATGGLANSTAGVLNLSGDSSAKGIGVQMLDTNGNAFKYDGTQYTVANVTSTPGSYTVNLKAVYYQTSAVVVAGTANAKLMFTITYQ